MIFHQNVLRVMMEEIAIGSPYTQSEDTQIGTITPHYVVYGC